MIKTITKTYNIIRVLWLIKSVDNVNITVPQSKINNLTKNGMRKKVLLNLQFFFKKKVQIDLFCFFHFQQNNKPHGMIK